MVNPELWALGRATRQGERYVRAQDIHVSPPTTYDSGTLNVCTAQGQSLGVYLRDTINIIYLHAREMSSKRHLIPMISPHRQVDSKDLLKLLSERSLAHLGVAADSNA